MDDFKKQLIIKLSIALGIISVFSVALVLMGRDIGKRAQAIRDQRIEIANRNQSLSVIANLQKDFNDAQKYTSILENALPTSNQLFDFPKELEFLAKKQNMGFGFSFGSETPPSESQPGSAAFVLTIQGTRAQIINFIKTLEEIRFLVNIGSIDISGAGDGFGATIGGIVYFQ